METNKSSQCTATIQNKLSEFQLFLRQLALQGGPTSRDHFEFTKWLHAIAALKEAGLVSHEEVRKLCVELGEAMTTNTMQGFAMAKPHGYSGDFEIIERIYSKWISPIPHLSNWDVYFHQQAAPEAVRNRKRYFLNWLCSFEAKRDGETIRLLNVGSGPARDVREYYVENPRTKVFADCVEQDAQAIEFGTKLCEPFAERVRFHTA